MGYNHIYRSAVYKKNSAPPSLRCPHGCDDTFHNKRSLSAHVWQCPRKPTVSYTGAEMSRNVTGGTVNPHDFQHNFLYSNQLYDRPAIDSHISNVNDAPQDEGQGNDTHPFDELNFDNHPSHSDSELNHGDNTLYDADDDDSLFAPSLDTRHLDDDMSLNDDDNFFDEEELPSLYLKLMHRYDEMKNTTPVLVETSIPECLQYQDTEDIQVTALTQLLLLVNKSGASKKMFDDLVHFITTWVKHYPTVFDSPAGHSQQWTREKLINRLASTFKTGNMKPKRINVRLHDDRLATVPVPNFEAMATDLLNDPRFEEYLAEGIDPKTFETAYDPEVFLNDPDAIIGEMHTGWNYMEGVKLHLRADRDKTKERPLCITINADGTHGDRNGALKVIPVQFSFSMFGARAQSNIRAWRTMGYIPNIYLGKGKDGRKSSDGKNHQQDFHLLMKAVMSSLQETFDNGGFYWKNRRGETILLKVFLERNNGDISGNNDMCNHKNTSTTRLVCKECKCEQHHLIQIPSRCELPTLQQIRQCKSEKAVFQLFDANRIVSYWDLSRIKNNKVYAHSISKHAIENAFEELPLSDPYQGIVGISPYDPMHTVHGGVFRSSIDSHKHVIGPKNTNSKRKAQINNAFSTMKFLFSRNSDRDFKRMSNRNGFFNQTNITMSEICGNYFGFIVLMHTSFGRDVLTPGFEAIDVDYNDAIKTNLLLVSWDRFYQDFNKRSDIQLSHQATQRLIRRILLHIPREERSRDGSFEGSFGWMIAKLHALLFAARSAEKFGCARTYCTSSNEHNHLRMVKDHVKRTQRIGSKFTCQVADNEYERVILQKASAHMHEFIPRDLAHLTVTDLKSEVVHYSYEQYSDSDDDEVEEDDDTSVNDAEIESTTDRLHKHDADADNSVISTDLSHFDVGIDANITDLSGTYDQVIEINHRGRRTVRTKWRWEAKERNSTATNDLVHFAISNYHVKTCEENGLLKSAKIEVECHTAALINGHRYRCAADYRGHKWYDWAMLRFPKTVNSVGGSVCLGRIMGIFCYKSARVFTYGMMEIKGYDVDDVVNSYMVDQTVYMVVHCSDNDLTKRHIRNNVVVPFQLTDLSDLYILPVSSIQGPAIVIPDFLSETELSSRDFFAVCPRRMLGHYFRRYCREDDEDFEVDLNQEDRFDSDNEEFILADAQNNMQAGSSEEEGYFDESDDEEEYEEDEDQQEPYGDDASQGSDQEMIDYDDDASGDESIDVYYDSSGDECVNEIVVDEHGNRILYI